MNTVCSPCITKLEDLKKNLPNLRLLFEKITDKTVHTYNPEITGKNISIGNVIEMMEKSHVNEILRTQSTIHINHIFPRENTQSEKVAKIGENATGTSKKQRQLTCDFCQKAFNHMGDLNKHRRKHTGEQPYTCNKCQQKFSYASNLIRHQRAHFGIRPFSCQTCGRTFTRKDKLSAHLMTKRCTVNLKSLSEMR